MADNVVQYIVNLVTSQADKNLRSFTKQTQKAGEALKDFAKPTKESTQETQKYSNNLKKAKKSSDTFKASTLMAADSLLNLKDRFVSTIKSVVGLAQAQADLINDLNDLSTRSGISAKSIQGLQLAFRASGQDAGQVKQLLDKMPVTMSALANGTGAATKAFNKLGLSAFETDGTLKSSQKVFMEVTNELQKMKSGTEKAAIASDIFGRQAGNMLQAFGNTEGLQDFVHFTDKYGLDTGPEASKQAAEFQQAIAMLEVVVGKLGQTLFNVFGQAGFITILKKAGGAMVDLGVTISGIVEFIKESFERMSQFGEEVAIQWELDFNRAAMRIAGAISMIPGVVIDITDQQNSFDEATKKLDEFTERKINFPSISEAIEKALNDGFRAQKDFEKGFDNLIEGIGLAREKSLEGILGQASSESIKIELPTDKDISDAINVDSLIKELELLEFQMSGVFKRINRQMKIGMITGATEGITGAVAGGPSAIVGSIASAAGPHGAAVGEIINNLAAIGEKSPEEIQQEMEVFTRAVANGLAMLPEILIQVLPPMLLRLSAAIVKAIFQLPILIGEAILEGIKSIVVAIKEFFETGRERRQERRQDRRESRRESRREWWDDLLSMRSGGKFLSGQGGLRFTGSQSGLAILHPGETVVPQSGQMSQTVSRSVREQMGGGININVNADIVESNAVDGLVRKIEERFRTFGNSRSPLFQS